MDRSGHADLIIFRISWRHHDLALHLRVQAAKIFVSSIRKGEGEALVRIERLGMELALENARQCPRHAPARRLMLKVPMLCSFYFNGFNFRQAVYR